MSVSGNHDNDTESDNKSVCGDEKSVFYYPPVEDRGVRKYLTEGTRHAGIALFSLLSGIAINVASFAMFGIPKSPSEEKMLRRNNEGFGDTSNLAWGRIGPARSVLSFFVLCWSSLVLYIPVRLSLAVIDEDKTTSNENSGFDEGNQSGVRKPIY